MPTPRSNKSRSSSRKSIKRSSFNKTKRVKFHSPKNEIKLYELDSAEKRMKVDSPKHLNVANCGKDIYPCHLRGVVFENKAEWEDYLENLRARNVTTGHKPVSLHRKSIMSNLSRQGKSSKRIPPEFRLYNIETGEITDMRTLGPKSLVYK